MGNRGVFSFLFVAAATLYLLLVLGSSSSISLSQESLNEAGRASIAVFYLKSNVDVLFDQAIEHAVTANPSATLGELRIEVAESLCLLASQLEEQSSPASVSFYFAQADSSEELLDAKGRKATQGDCVGVLSGLVVVYQIQLEQAMDLPGDALELAQLELLFGPKAVLSRVSFTGGEQKNTYFYALLELGPVRQFAALTPGYSLLVTPEVLH
ncbi:MAG TPA: hypothetical protein VJI67_02625 [archaeon]|nr:hypothetical protein [archaeon]HLD80444.1 hypothetical protein [archaeon]